MPLLHGLPEPLRLGALVVGRRTFEMAGEWSGDHHGVPIFVLIRRAADTPRWPLVAYVDDVADAMARAKAAAGEHIELELTLERLVRGRGLRQPLPARPLPQGTLPATRWSSVPWWWGVVAHGDRTARFDGHQLTRGHGWLNAVTDKDGELLDGR